MESSIQVPTLIGREKEMELLQQALDQSFRGRGRTVFIGGEAGIGKTRLTDEIISRAGEATILKGWCLAENIEPLFPLRTALRDAGLEHIFTGEKPPRLLSLYLIDRAGMLLARSEEVASDIEPDIFAGMLTAVSNFVKDSLQGMEAKPGGGLNVMGYGSYRIVMEYSENCCLAAVISGKENEFLLDDMKRVLTRVEADFSEALRGWSGSLSMIKGIEKPVEALMALGKYEGRFLVDDPRILQENIFDNVLLGIQRLSGERPVLLFLDDIQWCDPTSLNLLHYLSRNLRGNHVLVIGTFRPEDLLPDDSGKPHPLETVMQNMSREDLFTSIQLNRLSEPGTGQLINSAMGPNLLNGSFQGLVYRETEGTPFYILEIIKLLVEEGSLVRDGGLWALKVRAEDLSLPSKVLDVVKRRLNRLAREQREMLETASVIGSEFESGILGSVMGANRIQLLRSLSELERTHRLIHSSQGAYRFDHSKIRDVLYNGIIDELRAEMHRMVAEAIVQAGDSGGSPGDAGFHFLKANDPRASPFLEKAGDLAKDKFANREAIWSYTNALRFLRGPDRLPIVKKLGDVYGHVGDFENSIKCYGEVLEAEQDGSLKADMHYKLSFIYEQLGMYDRSIEECQKGLELVESSDEAMASKLLNALSWASLRVGDLKKADEYMARSLDLATNTNQEEELAKALKDRGAISRNLGDLETAQDLLLDALRLNKELNDVAGLSSTMNNLGLIYQHKGELAKCLEYYEMALEMFKKIGQKGNIAIALTNIGNTHLDRGDLDKALECHEEALAINRSIGARGSIAHSLTCIGYTYYDMGRFEKTLEFEGQSNDICDEIGYHTLQVYNYYNSAEALIALGRLDEAGESGKKSLEMSKGLEFPNGIVMGLRVVGMVHREKGELEESLDMLMESLGMSVELEDMRERARSKYELGLLFKRMGRPDDAACSLEESLKEHEEMGMKLWVEKVRSALED